jgi:hypothetical protein
MIIDEVIVCNRISQAALVNEDLYYINFLSHNTAEVNDFKEGYEAYSKLTKGVPFKVIVEFGDHVHISTEAREFAQLNKLPAKAEALIVKSLGQRMLANFYIKLKLQPHPTRVFKSFKEAKNWIESI